MFEFLGLDELMGTGPMTAVHWRAALSPRVGAIEARSSIRDVNSLYK